MYKNYVENIKLKCFTKLIFIPLMVAILTYLLPQLLQVIIGGLMGDISIGSIGSIMGMITTLFIMPLLMVKISKLKIENLGIRKEKLLKSISLGSISGFLLLSLVALTILILGGITIEKNSFSLTTALVGGLVFFILQGTWEELIYRSYLMPLFSKKYGDILSIILTSIVFTLGHALNPNIQLLPIVNLFIASIVFSLIYYRSGNLFFVGLAHGIWNFSQGYIWGSEVSGNIISASLFKSLPVYGKDIISGGNFGFEGGIITTIVGIVLIAILILILKNTVETRFNYEK